MAPELLKILESTQQFVNAYGVLITIIEGRPKKISARAAYNSKHMESIKLNSNISMGKLQELTLTDLLMMKKKAA